MSFDDPDDDFLNSVPKPERKVIPKQYDAPLRFTVPSSSRPGEVHLVDLGALGANGFVRAKILDSERRPSLSPSGLPIARVAGIFS